MKPILIEYIDENGTTWDCGTYMDGLTESELADAVALVKREYHPKKVLVIEKQDTGNFAVKEM